MNSNKNYLKFAIIIILFIIIAISVFRGSNNKPDSIKKATIESGSSYGIIFDDKANVHLDDEDLAIHKLEFDQNLKKYVIKLEFKKPEGKTKIYITDNKGKVNVLNLEVTKNSYTIGNASY